jgi:Flp pilus assembly protein TadD
MAPSLLANLALTPTQVAALPAAIVRRVVHFLLRWEAFADVLACLEQMAQPPGDAASLRARALQGLGRHSRSAAAVAGAPPDTARPGDASGAGRAGAGSGDPDQAQAHLAHALTPMRHLSRTWWLAVRIHLARGDDAAAQQAIQQLTALAPESPYLSLSMMARLRTRGDTVTATAYAVRPRSTPTAATRRWPWSRWSSCAPSSPPPATASTWPRWRRGWCSASSRSARAAGRSAAHGDSSGRRQHDKPTRQRRTGGDAFDFAAHRRRDGRRTPGAAQGSAHQLWLCHVAARPGRNPDVCAPRRTRAGDPADRRRQVALLPASRL